MKHRDFIPGFRHVAELVHFSWRGLHGLRFVARAHIQTNGWLKQPFQTIIEAAGRMNDNGFYVKRDVLERGRTKRVFREL